MNVGQRVRLKRSNLSGKGEKGVSGTIVSLLYKPIDDWECIVRFDDGGTEGFMFKDLEKKIKSLTLVSR